MNIFYTDWDLIILNVQENITLAYVQQIYQQENITLTYVQQIY
jgi:hypothetical protein